MIKKIIVVALCSITLPGFGQKYTAEKSFVSFFSHGAIEDIAAENTKTVSLFNTATGDVVFSIPIKEFEFDKSLMKEHFNEKYMDTEKFPKSTFQGKISGFQPDGKGEQQATASGKLTMHGVTQEVLIPGTVEVVEGKIVMKSKFIVKLADYKIEIPKLLWQNIAEQVEVKIEFTYKPL
jgi:polyisoprenoid-binding protein YceI